MVSSLVPCAPDICARRAEKPDQVGDFRLSRRAVKRDGSTGPMRRPEADFPSRQRLGSTEKYLHPAARATRPAKFPSQSETLRRALRATLHADRSAALPTGTRPEAPAPPCPHLARSAPRNKIDERIFPASRFSTQNFERPEASIQSVLPSRRVLQPRLSRIASAVRTSSMSGQLCNTHGEVHRQHAARTGSTLFFAPCIRTVPERRAPPVIRSFFILIPPHSG